MNYRNIKSVDELLTLLQEAHAKAEEILEAKDEPKDEDKLEVHYADEGYGCIFKHIIMFTNNKDPKQNKTLKNVYDAIDNIKKKKAGTVPELHLFEAEEVVTSELEDGAIKISDKDNEFIVNDEISNADTLVFNRLGAIGEDECETVVEKLQDRGFLVLNPVRGSLLACDKYDTSVLLQKGNIPQPNFALMTKDVLYDEKLYSKALKSIYKEWTDDNEDLMFVVKILDGHGGTGVALIPNKYLKAWLQLVFAVDADRSLLIQRKEEADGGDIRVHVLTLRNKQVILAAMKRVKIEKDFRSNVSLGASAEPVKLTPEQEQIALRTAKLSTLPWCAVDIMPLVKGSNKELGDNVVLEINASPGTDGISDVLDYNFVNVLINELDDSKEFKLQNKIAGYIETATVNFGDNPIDVLALLDTGNGTAASHIEVGDYTETEKDITFSFFNKKYTFEKTGTSNAIVGTEKFARPIITVPYLKLGRRVLTNVPIAIVKKREKSTNMLINRDLISKFGYSVSANDKHLLSREMEKIQII